MFVHGCFWHRHSDCRYCTTPAANAEFWHEKFSRNVERDVGNANKLVEAGWRIYVAWECDIKRSPTAVAEAIQLFAMSTGAVAQH